MNRGSNEVATELERMYRAHADFVWRSVQRFGVAPAHAEDVVHEVFLVVQRRLDELDPKASVRGWLWGIARGVAANHRRGRTRAAKREQVSLELVTPPAFVDPEEHVQAARAAAMVQRFLEQLPPDKRAVFELADIEGFSCPEIAALLELELGTVYAQLRTARRRFLAFLQQARDFSPRFVEQREASPAMGHARRGNSTKVERPRLAFWPSQYPARQS